MATEDLIDIPPEIDTVRVSSESHTAYPETLFIGSIVRFNEEPPSCWAHSGDRRFCVKGDCRHHGCDDPADGRLGLCRYHTKEILG